MGRAAALILAALLAANAFAQGGRFGIGRKVYEGDKDYNRGSLNRR